MTDPQRAERNQVRLATCHPVFAARAAAMIADLETAGWRPRIQDAWRSPQDQAAARASGHSKLSWGFHNAMGPNGEPEALAIDLLDDAMPLHPSRPYLIALAHFAGRHQLQTGILWGLPQALKAATRAAVEGYDTAAKVKTGWDPTHVEIADVTVREARAGARPSEVIA